MVRAVPTRAYDTAICGKHHKGRMSRSGPKKSSSRKDFYLGGILSMLRHFAGDDIILLVG